MNGSKKILISGAAGFLGSKLIPQLCKHGYIVTAIVRSKESYLNFQEEQNLTWLERDIGYSPLTNEEASIYDAIIHLAGVTDRRGDDLKMHILANEMTTIGLANQETTLIKKFIYASSQVVYGNPNSKSVDESFPVDPAYSAYATSKINSENWLRLYQSRASNMVLSLRLCGFVDGGGLIDSLISDALVGSDLELFGHGNVCRDYIHSSIFVDLIIRLLELEFTPNYSVLNIGSGQEMSAFQIASLIKELTNSSSRIIRSPKAPLRRNFVYKIDKMLSITDILLPSLSDQVLAYVKSKMFGISARS